MADVERKAVEEEGEFKMKLAVVKKKKGKITFEVSGTTPAYINTLRRIFMTHVPTMAIGTVEFKQNSSALYDELIAHRLGLLALKTDLKSYNVPEKNAVPSAATHATLSLKAVGPKVVYASELKSSDPKIVPVYPETPIALLLDNQELELVATAHLGFGKDHAKWSTGLVSYYYKPKITVNNKSSKLGEFIDKYPAQIKSKGVIDAEKIDSPELIDACRDICEDIVKIEYPEHQTDFVFTIESWGQLTPDEIVEEGIKQYDAQLDEFKKLIKEI